MKIFQTVRRQYAILGIIRTSNQSIQKYPFTKTVFFGLSSVGCLIISQFMYIFYEANGFMDYINAICATSVTIIIFVCIAAIAFKRTVLFEHYDKIETLLDTSKKQF